MRGTSTSITSTRTRVGGAESGLAAGFGKAAEDADYPAVYLSGRVAGAPGIFRSDDAGASWTRISDDRNQFGWVGFLADERTHGRVYLGTGGRGIVYGDPL